MRLLGERSAAASDHRETREQAREPGHCASAQKARRSGGSRARQTDWSRGAKSGRQVSWSSRTRASACEAAEEVARSPRRAAPARWPGVAPRRKEGRSRARRRAIRGLDGRGLPLPPGWPRGLDARSGQTLSPPIYRTRGLDPAKGVDFRVHRNYPHLNSMLLSGQGLQQHSRQFPDSGLEVTVLPAHPEIYYAPATATGETRPVVTLVIYRE